MLPCKTRKLEPTALESDGLGCSQFQENYLESEI